VIALYADGGPAAGLGHVRRALALAAALAPWADCRLLLSGDAEVVAQLVQLAGVPCLPVSGERGSTLTAVRALGASGLVVDSYEVSTRELEAVLERVRLLVVMDDTGRFPVPGHLVVNPALGVVPPEGGERTRYLLGPRFAPLAREFAEPPGRSWRESVERILLVLGGATSASLMAALARVVRRALPEATLDVIVGPAGDVPAAVTAALAGLGGVILHAAPESIRALMLDADLAVTAGGVTLLELAATSTPSVGVSVVSNQQANLAGLARSGALLLAGGAGDPGLPDALEAALTSLTADAGRRRALGERARQLVDGRGAARVAEAMRELLAEVSLAARGGRC
jgi:spore coat polysaccharide biosynthesis predicted glycosyltransferase SpsG